MAAILRVLIAVGYIGLLVLWVFDVGGLGAIPFWAVILVGVVGLGVVMRYLKPTQTGGEASGVVEQAADAIALWGMIGGFLGFGLFSGFVLEGAVTLNTPAKACLLISAVALAIGSIPGPWLRQAKLGGE